MRVRFPGAVRAAHRFRQAAPATKVGALLLFSLIIIGGAAGILALGSLHVVSLFGLGLGGGEAQGSSFNARTRGSYETGSQDAQGTAYSANVGLLGMAVAGVHQPAIRAATATPHLIEAGAPVNLFIDALYASNVGAVVTLPDNTTADLPLTNGENTTYNGTALTGHYIIIFTANSSNGTATAADYFDAAPATLFNLTVIDNSSQGIPSAVTITYGGDNITSNSSVDGNFSITVPAAVASVAVTAYNNSFTVILNDINLTDQGVLGLDRHNSIPGFLVTYGVDNSLNFTNATVEASYQGLQYTTENNLHLYKCDEYNFTNQSCNGSWDDVTAMAVQNTVTHQFEYPTTSFSGFSIKEVAAPAPVPRGGGGGGGGGGSTLLELSVSVEKKCDEQSVHFNITGFAGSPVMAGINITGKSSGFSRELLTDTAGVASIPLDEGQYYLSFSKNGYETQDAFLDMNCTPTTTPNASQPSTNGSAAPPVVEKPTQPPGGQWEMVTNTTNASATEEEGSAPSNQTVLVEEQRTSAVEEGIGATGWLSLLSWTAIGLIIVILGALLAVIVVRRTKGTKRPASPRKSKKEKRHIARRTSELQPAPSSEAPVAISSTTMSEAISNQEMPELVVGPGVPAGGQKGRVDTAEPEIHEKLSWPSEAHAPQLAETTSLEPSEPIVTEAQASATEQYLRDLEEAHWFSLADGRRLKSVPELVKALPDMANEVFASHVTADRNDFAAWISSSVGDTELARQLGPVKSRPEMLRILLSRVEAILRAAHGQRGGEMEERLGRVEAALKLYESIGAGNGKAA